MAFAPFPLGPRGDFELLELLGSGAMGAVYRARESTSKREVALKVLLGYDAAARVRFSREGEIAASLSHPAIMRVHSAGLLEGHPYLACELIPGSRTLDEVWPGVDRRGRVALLAQAARALGFAHRQGVLHRDVKPANLLVDPDGQLKVADFGLATMEGLERLTRTGAVVGTALYMAPEVVAGERERVGPQADVWSLGVVLYELLADGTLPFDAPGWVQLASQILSASPPPLTQVAPGTPASLARIVDRALAKEPARRYPHGDAFAADLELYLRGGEPQATRVRRAWPWGGAAVGFLLGAASIVAGWALGWPREPEPAPTVVTSNGRPRATAPDARVPVNAWRPPRRVLRLQHGAEAGRVVTAFASPQRLLSWGQDGWLRAWDRQTGALLEEARHVEVSRPSRPLLAVLPRGELVVGLEGRLRWLGEEPSTGDALGLEALCLSRDGRALATTRPEDLSMVVYDVATRRLLRGLGQGDSPVHALCFDRSGRSLIAARGDSGMGMRTPQVIERYDLASGARRWRQLTYGRVQVLLCDDDDRVWLGSRLGLVEPRSLEDGEPLLALESPTPDQELWPGAKPATLPGCVWGLAERDGRLVAVSGATDRPESGRITVWDAASGELLHTREGLAGQELGLSLSEDGEQLAVGNERGAIEVWALRER